MWQVIMLHINTALLIDNSHAVQSRLYADYGRIRAKEEPAAGATSPGATGPQSPPGSGGGLGGTAPPQRPHFPPASGPGLGAMQHTVCAPRRPARCSRHSQTPTGILHGMATKARRCGRASLHMCLTVQIAVSWIHGPRYVP